MLVNPAKHWPRPLNKAAIVSGAVLATLTLIQPAFAHDGTCDAKPWRIFLGQPLERIDLATLPEIFRVIYPDSAPEVEPDDDRLNIVVDEVPTITDIFCG